MPAPLPPQKVSFRLDAQTRAGLARVMAKRGITLSEALRLAVERMLESEGLPGFHNAELRAGYKEGVRRGAAAIERAIAGALSGGALSGVPGGRVK